LLLTQVAAVAVETEVLVLVALVVEEMVQQILLRLKVVL
jgi:hypothetical protein